MDGLGSGFADASNCCLDSDPGVVGLLPYSAEGRYRLYYGLIVDGFHTHDASVRLAYAMHPKGCILVTDATAAMGLEPGQHMLGDSKVVLSADCRMTVLGTDTLAGSAASMDVCVRNFAACGERIFERNGDWRLLFD